MSEIVAENVNLIQEELSKLDVDALGIASVAELREGQLREQIRELMPDARSVIAVGSESFVELLDLARPNKMMGEASAGDMFRLHQEWANSQATKAASQAARMLRRGGFKAMPITPGMGEDTLRLTALVSFKHVAQAAGLGSIGWNALLLSPEYGPRLKLACAITNAPLQPTRRPADDLCTECDLCIDACPTGALARPENGEPYVINKFACKVYRSGTSCCVECMRVCPMGR